MNEETPKRTAAPIPGAGNEGNGKAADIVSTPGQKNLSGTWKRIGRVERVGEGVRICFSLFAEEHTVYLIRREVAKITQDRLPGDLCTIQETANEIITANIGKAFRSRTGKALMIRTPYFSGDLMTPWQTFMAVLQGRIPSAPVSILDQPENCQQAPTAALDRGLQGCF